MRYGLAIGAALLAFVACRDQPPQLAASPAPAAAPRIVALDPADGDTAVDPTRTTLSATFDREMDHEGWAWVIEGPATAPDVGESSWDATFRKSTVKVRLEPGRTYTLWINSPQYSYFKDLRGVPLEPVRWTFTTRNGAAAGPLAPLAAHSVAPPQVVAFDPPNGATGVDPSLKQLRATFDRPMEKSWAWVTEGSESFPETTGEAFFEAGARTVALPVRLAPGRTYIVWLNSDEHLLFRDDRSTPLRPVRWTFTTRAAAPAGR